MENVLRRQQACRYYDGLLTDAAEKEVSDDDETPVRAYVAVPTGEDEDPDDTQQLWNFFESKVAKYSGQSSEHNLRHYLAEFWKRKFPNDAIHADEMDDDIVVGRRLFLVDSVYDAKYTKRNTTKLSHFTRLIINVDVEKTKRGSTTRVGQDQAFFGEALLFFVHKYKGRQYKGRQM